MNSIGQCGDLGTNGVVVWGDSYAEHTYDECINTMVYIDTLLGPYVQQVLSFTNMCSVKLCSSHGRCALKNISSLTHTKQMRILQDAYNLKNKREIKSANDIVKVETNKLHDTEFKMFSRKILEAYKFDHGGDIESLYKCKCYKGWTGTNCDQNTIMTWKRTWFWINA